MEKSKDTDVTPNWDEMVLASCHIEWKFKLYDSLNNFESADNRPLTHGTYVRGYETFFINKSEIKYKNNNPNRPYIARSRLKNNEDLKKVYYLKDSIISLADSSVGYAVVHPLWMDNHGYGYFTDDNPKSHNNNAPMLYYNQKFFYDDIRILVQLTKTPNIDKDWKEARVLGIFNVNDWEENIIDLYLDPDTITPPDTRNESEEQQNNITSESPLDPIEELPFDDDSKNKLRIEENTKVISFRVDKELYENFKALHPNVEPREIFEQYILDQGHHSITKCFNIFRVCSSKEKREKYYKELDEIFRQFT